MTAKPYTAPVCELLDPEIHPPPRGVIDWLIVKTATLPKSSTRADVARKLKEIA